MSKSSASGATKLFSLAMFGVVSVVCGVLVAGLVVPYAAMATASAKLGAAAVDDLPEELRIPSQGQRSQVFMANGELLTNFFNEYRIYKPLDEISPTMQQAQLAIEDHRFYEHGPLDPMGFMRALATNIGGGDTQGGSSITQQYVKMAQIDIAKRNNDEAGVARAQEPTLQRKVQELRYAIALEKELEKKDIFERYLNIAYYGAGAYGVEAAAQIFFGKSAKDLNLPESAMLAGMVQNPSATDPTRDPKAALQRRNVVLNRMAEPDVAMITKEEAEEAKKAKFDEKKIKRPTNNCAVARYPFLCDYVKRTIINDPRYGKTVEDRENLLMRGGLKIETDIDPGAQDRAEQAVNRLVNPRDPVIATMVQIQPGTGLIVSMAQSRPKMGTNKDAGETFFNYAAGLKDGMGGAEGYQMGSTFKIFTAAAAIERGIPVSQSYNSPSGKSFAGRTYQTCNGPAVEPKYNPANSTGSGTFDMRSGTARSINTYFVELQIAAGPCRVAQMADKSGLKLSQGGTLVDPGPELDGSDDDPPGYDAKLSMTLGTPYVTPLSVGAAYATFAARGKYCKPIIIRSIKAANGKDIEAPSADCKQVMDQGVADATTALLQGVMSNGTGRRARIGDGRPQAGKTGTTDSNKSVWFAGFTPELAGAAMISTDNKSPFWKETGRRESLKGLRLPISGRYLEGSGGGDAGSEIYKPTMEEALRDKPRTPFQQPAARFVEGKTVPVPSTAGMNAAQAKATLEQAGFATVRTRVFDSRPAGTYLGTSPKGQAKAGQQISLMYSKGPRPKPKPKPAPKPPPPPPAPPADDKKPEPPKPPGADKPQEPKDSGGGG